MAGFIRGRWTQALGAWAKRSLLSRLAPTELGPRSWPDSLEDPTGFYRDCFRYFHQRLPEEVKNHRRYFTRQRRGFGEDAFHVLWFLLMQEYKPGNFLEIGVYRGQTISLAALLSRRLGTPCEVHGVSPFSSAGDSVSRYRRDVDYLSDTRVHFDYFRLPEPALLCAMSTDPAAHQLIESRAWDMIYIDGNHDYDVARHDWEICTQALKAGGVVVLDDAGLNTSFHPPRFATAGHPGPSRLAGEVDRSRFQELVQVGHNRAFRKIAE